MNITILCNYDFSGNMYNLCSSINKYTDHSCTMIKYNVNPLYKYDSVIIANKDNINDIKKIIYTSDVIVFKETYTLIDLYKIDIKRLKNKKIVVLLGGLGFRQPKILELNKRHFGNINNNVKWGATSIDFLEKHPEWAWIPASIQVDRIRSKYNYKNKINPPLIVASPSKSTNIILNMKDNFNNTINEIKKEFQHFQYLFIENKTNAECLSLKAPGSIFFDRIYDIYGINSQESAALELAIVTGSSSFVINKLKHFGFECPFIFVNNYQDTKKHILSLLKNEDFRKEKATECYKYVNKAHSGIESTSRLVELIKQ